jgi:hypothetical protein
MGRLYQVVDPSRLRARREAAPSGRGLEVWADVAEPETCWLVEAAWLALRETDAGPVPAVRRIVEGDEIPILFAADVVAPESLPNDDAVRARVLSRRGMAAFWVPPAEVGPQVQDTAVGPHDLFFYQKRLGAAQSHLWRLFRSRYDARGFLGRRYPGDLRVEGFLARLPHEDFDALVAAATVS